MEWLFVIIGFNIAAHYFPYLDKSNKLFSNTIQASVVLLIVWGLFNLTKATPLLFSRINRRKNVQIDEILIPFISKWVQVVIVAIGISIVAEVYGFGISGFVAGLGLGGLAFALAAQDVIANLFGGFVIITERPFSIGDWIESPSVEGTVEDISFRSTKVRTFAQSVVTVPNSTLANEPITNWSKMGKRQVSFSLRVTYDSPMESVKRAVNRIRQMLMDHEEIHQETILVHYSVLQDTGGDIMVYYFTKATSGSEHHPVKEDVNYKILEILKEEGVEIAMPSRRLLLESPEQ